MPNSRRLALAVVAGIGIIVWAPLADIARASLRALVPGRFAVAVYGIIGGAILIALAAGVARIRAHAGRRAAPAPSAWRPVHRSFLLLLTLSVGVVYARASSTGNPEVDAVERLHFIQYGLLTWLFYRAWLPVGDRSVLMAPVFAGLFVGTLDEWCQWLIPYRVGEAHDVFLNGAAIACGLLFSVAIEPPAASGTEFRPGSLRRLWLPAAAAWVAFVLFFNAAHVAYEIRSVAGDRFLSSLSASALAAAAKDRQQRWRGMTSPELAARVSIEDRYLTEGLWHVQYRNQKLGEGKLSDAWSENRILEEFYDPVLDRPISNSPAGSRLPPTEVEASRATGKAEGYISAANPFPLYAWPKWLFWIIAIGGGVLLTSVGIIRQ